jgi:protein SCO1/2
MTELNSPDPVESVRPRGWTMLAVVLLACFTTVARSEALKAGVFDPPRVAPNFVLDGSNGEQLALEMFKGKVVVLGFGFTSCPAVCPTTLGVLAAAKRRLGAAGGDVQVVYVTVDPLRDTPEHMKKYLGTFDATFLGGSGTEQSLAKVRASYGIQAEKKSFGDDHTYAHSSYTYFIDRKGVLRALMPYGRSPEDYVHDLKILLAER